MIVETRKTAAGTEYWDAKNKKSIFVPKGQKPSFEVTKNPRSMIYGVDLAKGEDKTVIDGKVVDNQPDMNLEDMNAEQLLSFAKQANIDIPGNIKKEDTIRKHIEEVLAANDDK